MATKNSVASVPRYVLSHAALGCAVGACFPLILWATDTGNFGSLLSSADTATLIIVIAGSMLTFCPLVVATAIGLLASSDP